MQKCSLWSIQCPVAARLMKNTQPFFSVLYSSESHCYKLLVFLHQVRIFWSLDWDCGGVLNAPRSCWSLFMCLVPVCRTRCWKISEILFERLQGHTLAGVPYICVEPSQNWAQAFGAQKNRPRLTANCVKKLFYICFKKININIDLLPLNIWLKYIWQIFITLCGCTLTGTDVSFFEKKNKTFLRRQINIKYALSSCRFP